MEAEVNEAIRQMRAAFLVPAAAETTFAGFDQLAAAAHPDYKPRAAAFRQNLASCVSTVAMSFAFASASVDDSHFQRIHIAERIRARSIEDGVEDDPSVEEIRDRAASQKAHSRMREFVESEDGRNAIIRDVCHFLLNSLHGGLGGAAEELLRQGAVLLWSAFEVFFRDVFELHLNREPHHARALMDHPSTRKRFDAEKWPLDTLIQHGFNLSGKVGSILVRQEDFNDLRTIMAAYPVLFPAAGDLIASLGDRDLWTLFQRRHLIVHRRGVVDQAYLDETGDLLPLGSQISITPARLESDLTVVLECGECLCRCLGAVSQAAN
jgi:hypothetical protein